MNSSRATTVLKTLIWLLYIGGNVLNLIFVALDLREFGVEYWALVSIPISIAYIAGGWYVLQNLPSFLSRRRLELIRGLIVLFAIDTLYAIASTLASIFYPSSFTVVLEPMPTGDIATGTAIGFGLSVLVLFAIIQLINVAAGTARKKPPTWVTATAWAVVLCMIATVIAVASLGE